MCPLVWREVKRGRQFLYFYVAASACSALLLLAHCISRLLVRCVLHVLVGVSRMGGGAEDPLALVRGQRASSLRDDGVCLV